MVFENPMLDELNMRYILAVEPVDDPALKPVYDDEILIYENLKAVPRVMLYHDYTMLENEEAVLDALTASDFDPFTTLYFGGEVGFGRQVETGRAASIATDANARITRYEPNRVTIEVSTSEAAILLLADVNYPGWKAYIDSDETPIATGNYLFRAVEVPAGDHVIEFRYESDVIRTGEIISAVSFALLIGCIIALILYSIFTRRRQDS